MIKDHLLTEVTGNVLILTLNRPESLNAFSPEMIADLTKEIKDVKEKPHIRAVVIKGAGRSFTAGGDVKSMGKASAGQLYDHVGRMNECILALDSSEVPVIAAVHGFAAGAGFNLALACDLIIASEDSQFAMSFSQVGLISDGGGSYFLPKLVGPHLAKQLFFSAEPISAERLYQLGIINYVCPLEQLEEESFRLAKKLANGPTKAYGMMKKLVSHSFTATLDEMLEQERITQTLMASTEDHLEGIAAFKEKRKPEFTGN
ncbi:enoyl-CoA hydratase/isomerase family protein [Peribacillus muralis]|uniref:enoyl-CoA hydratase/isomerase family protein n=1 Tax=Peribacillus muralis TaxID=264697 RepID=UPI00070D11B8|nr:enoyl-CoA hydratase [Peribacillus muralis]